MVNVRAVKNALKLNENVTQNLFFDWILINQNLYKLFSSNSKSCDKKIVKRTEDVILKK